MPSTRARTRTRAQARAAAIARGPSAILRSRDGTTVPLQGVTAHGRLEGLIFELTVEQRYRNDTRTQPRSRLHLPAAAARGAAGIRPRDRRTQTLGPRRRASRKRASDTSRPSTTATPPP